MHRFILFAALISTTVGAATINGTTCPGIGCVTSYVPNSSAVAVQVTGTWAGTLVFEGGNDGTTFTPLRGYPVAGGSYTTSTSSNGAWTVPTGGLAYVRTRASAWTSGSAVVLPQASTSPVAVDVVRAVGSTFGEVQVSGIVDLSSATLASMGNYVCAAAESHRLNLTTTPTIVPTGAPIANRTSWTLINQDSVKKVACRVDPGDGGVPDCNTPGFGITVQPNGGVLTFPVRESDIVRCVACTNGATVEHTEEACVAP